MKNLLFSFRTLLLLAAFVCTSLSAYATTAIDFVMVNTSEEWAQALETAKQRDVKVFVDVYTDWCGYCKMMDRDVFSDAEVGRSFNEQFVNVKLDAETEFGEMFAYTYEVDGYPMYLFFDNEETLLGSISGYTDLRVFVKKTERIVQSASQLPVLSQKYEAGTLTHAEKAEYAVVLMEQDELKAKQLAKEVKVNLTAEDVLNPDFLSFLVTFGGPLDDRIWSLVKDNMDAFISTHGQSMADEVLGKVYNYNMELALDREDAALVEQLIEEVLPPYLETEEELIEGSFYTRKMYYGYTGNAAGYQQVVESYYGDHGATEEDFWYSQAYEIVEDYNAEEAFLDLAITWLTELVAQEEEFYNYILFSYALGMKGSFDEARAKALKAKDIAADSGELEMVNEVLAMIDEAEAD